MANKRPLTAKRFITDLTEVAAALRRRLEAEVSGFDPDPVASAARWAQAQQSFRFFVATYFPHYTTHAPSVLHEHLFQVLPEVVADPAGRRLALAAPRGEAKSTLVTKLFTLWCLLTERKRFVVIIMDSFDQAAVKLEEIKVELEANQRLLTDFPKQAGTGRVWNEGVAVTAGNAKVQAFGSGTRMRGLSHGPYRPDLVILDDIENDENVRSPEQRDKLERWLERSALSLGPPDDSMDVIFIGTVLHYDAVLSRKLAHALWEGKTFRAIIKWPDRMDLWDQWEELLLNDGQEAARQFYDQQSAAMEGGAVVSWPSARPLYALMTKRARDGHAAFDSEQQNDPLSGDENLFSGEGVIKYWAAEDPEWVFFGACDPSLGKHGASRDPCALLIGGYNRRLGRLDVVEAKIAKMLPDLIIETIIALQARWGCVLWVVEAVQFQEFFRTELVKRSAGRGFHVPARAITPSTDKTLRIETLQPHVANGMIRFHPSQQTLLQQLRRYPKADHDDGPDALEMLWKAAIGGGMPGAVSTVGHGPRPAITETGFGAVAGRMNRFRGYRHGR